MVSFYSSLYSYVVGFVAAGKENLFQFQKIYGDRMLVLIIDFFIFLWAPLFMLRDVHIINV